jgi:glycosyltransferase involved in cell wall biosynthesis
VKTLIHIISADDVFGPEKTVINECLALRGSDWHARIINIWHTDDTPISRKLREAGIDHECLQSTGKLDLGAIRALAGQLAAQPGTVAHSHGYKADLYTLLAARRAKVTALTTAHGWTSENAKVRLYERLQAFLWRFFDRVVCVSQSYRQLAIAAGVPDRKITVVHNAIRSSYQAQGAQARSAARAALGLDDDAQVVAIIGRLGIEKGHRLFVDAAAQLAPRFPKARFLIAGEGAQRAEIEAQVAQLKLDGTVRLLGHRNDLPAIYPALDLLAMASLREGLPNVLLEAMLHGVPGVTMAVGGIPEVVSDGVDGLLVPPGDLPRFVESLASLLGDPVRRAAMGAAAIAKVRDGFLFDARMKRMVEIYEAGLVRPGAPAPAAGSAA